MNPLKWFRWKYFVPFVVVTAAIVVFFVVFFDPLLARGIEKVGGKMNGAKVEVAGLKTKLFAGRLDIARLQVADPDQPMQNRVEAGPLAFQMNLSDLISKRVIINEATLKGLAFETPRKTSGALPRVAKQQQKDEKPSAAQKLVEKYKDRFKLNIDGLKQEAKSRIEFDPKDLTIVKSAESLKATAEAKPKEWEERIKKLDVDNRLKAVEAELKTLKNTSYSGPDALESISANLKKLKETKATLDTLKKEINDTKGGIAGEVKQLKGSVGGLSDAKKKDLDDLLSRLNLDFANPRKLMEGIIGPLVMDRFRTTLRYVQLARQHMPSKKDEESLPPKPRAKGMNIEFPTPAAPPRFWLIKGGLDGTFKSVGVTGSLSNLTTNPARVGKPFQLDLKGLHEGQTFLGQALFDHTTDVNKDSLTVEAKNLGVLDMIGEGGAQSEFSDGRGNMTLGFNMLGDDKIGGQLSLALTGLKFNPAVLLEKVGVSANAATMSTEDKLKADFMRNVAKGIESMKEVMVNAQITGTWQDPNLDINSNMLPAITSTIKDSIGTMVKDQRQQLEARLNQVLQQKQAELQAKLSGLDAKSNGQLAEFESKIQQKISEASGLQLSPAGSGTGGLKIPSLDKFFKK